MRRRAMGEAVDHEKKSDGVRVHHKKKEGLGEEMTIRKRAMG